MILLSFYLGNYMQYVPFKQNILDNTSLREKVTFFYKASRNIQNSFLFLYLKEWLLDK